MSAAPPAVSSAAAHLAGRYDLEGRVAVVSGASGLLGSAICRELSACGASLVLGRHRLEPAAGATGAVVVDADLGDPAAGTRLRDAALERFGRLDIVVAAAGTKHRGPALGLCDAELAGLLEVNVAGAVMLVRHCLRPMLRARWGRVVLLGSRAGSVGLPGQAAYAATKAALHAYAASLAGEVGRSGVTVNAVAPGAVHERQGSTYSAAEAAAAESAVAAGRLAQPEEVATVVAFLCSAASAYVTGAVVPVDGGARF